MGYNTFHRLSIVSGDDTGKTQEEWESEIEEFTEGRAYFGDEWKWYEINQDMVDFSQKYPEACFCIKGEGEEAGDLWKAYFKAGKVFIAKAEIVYPEFNESLLIDPEGVEVAKDKEIILIQLTEKSAAALKKELIKKQNNCCAATGQPLRKPVLDHEHRKGFLLSRSGQIRGVLESDVNQLLGKIEFGARRFGIPLDQVPDILRGLADYLERPLLPYLHPSEKPKDPIVMARSYTKLGNLIVQGGGGSKSALPKWWGYKTNKKGKPAQKMTKQLQQLYDKYELEPEFYK